MSWNYGIYIHEGCDSNENSFLAFDGVDWQWPSGATSLESAAEIIGSVSRVGAFGWPIIQCAEIETWLLTVPQDEPEVVSDHFITENQLNQLKALFSEGTTYELLYSGNRDGWSGNDFHSRVDGRAPTGTLIKN